MQRVKDNAPWSLMCPSVCTGLVDAVGDDFKQLYEKYEAEGKFIKQINAQELWEKLVVSQIETGTPYMLYKDAANNKSNQKNLGTIKSSNLCAEIMEYTSPKEIAVCNLASIALNMFVENGTINHTKLFEVAYQMALNLDKVIDVNFYPVEETRTSNNLHRPVGLGVQGLADVFMLLGLPFESAEAQKIDAEMHETIYFAALKASNDIAIATGETYSSFDGSPLSKGIFQFDMWGTNASELSGRHDWEGLRASIIEFGVRNSLSTALMPTASTGQILGNNECFEPYTSNIYTRRTLSGEYVMINKHLLKDLIDMDLWDDDMRQLLMAEKGSVQNLPIPDEM